MRRAPRVRTVLAATAWGLGLSFFAPAAQAQDVPRVSASRPVIVEGLSVDSKVPDLLGLARVRFQGLIALELSSVGYRVGDPEGTSPETAFILAGSVKEEACDDVAPSQCRVAIQWELQRRSGVVVYRTLTRAVDQQPNLERLRRGLVQGALRSLLSRRRFTTRLADSSGASAPSGSLGFKECRREAIHLPDASRAALAGLVRVESGSRVAGGAILSADGLILTSARELMPGAPLRVRFSAQQVLPARVVARAPEAGVALLRTGAHTASTCLPLGDEPLESGTAVFGVSTTLGEDGAMSLSGATVASSIARDGWERWAVPPPVAGAPGAPLLTVDGRLAATVVMPGDRSALGQALGARSALSALRLQPAAISDPRLLGELGDDAAEQGYVRDPDDPPFELTRRYTFGTGPAAGTLRKAGFVTAGVGALGVAATWLQFRGKRNVTAHEHSRLVVFNDVSWAVLALGAVGVGVSFALPQPHDVVAGHSSARRSIRLEVAASGLGVSGEL